MFWFWYATIYTLGLSAMISGLGFWMYKRPPKKINGFLGYRTPMSMKNQETWDFAQRYSGKLWALGAIINGLVFLLVILLCFRLPFFESIATALIFAQLVLLLLSIWPTERALRKNFDQFGYRK